MTVGIIIAALALFAIAFFFFRRRGKFITKRLPSPLRKVLVKVPMGPYRELAEQEGSEESKKDDEEPEPESGHHGCLTAAAAANRRQEIEDESTKDAARLFKDKIQPHVEKAIKELKNEAFCCPLSSAEIKVMDRFVKELGYEVDSLHEDSMRIKF